MIFKYISQRLLFLNLPPEYKENYVNRLQHMKLKYREAHNRKGTILKKVCNKFLLLCEQGIQAGFIEQGIRVIGLVKELVLEIYENQSADVWRINISGYVLALQCYELSGDLRSLKTFYQRIKLFLREFEERKLNEANSRDYYSNVERLYIELIRYQISQYARDPSDLSECQVYLSTCFEVLRNEIIYLNELMRFEDKRVYHIIVSKVDLLLQLFHFECAIKLMKLPDDPQSVPDAIYVKYERVFDPLPILIDKALTVARCTQMVSIASNKMRRTEPQPPKEVLCNEQPKVPTEKSNVVLVKQLKAQEIKESISFFQEINKNKAQIKQTKNTTFLAEEGRNAAHKQPKSRFGLQNQYYKAHISSSASSLGVPRNEKLPFLLFEATSHGKKRKSNFVVKIEEQKRNLLIKMNPFDLKVMKENVSLKRVRSKTLQLDSRAGALRSEIYVNGCC